MFFLTILRNITQWPCFPWKAHPYAAHYQKFVRYFVGYFLNFVAFCIIVVFSVIVWSNYLPEFEDKESEDYCVKEVYKISVGFLIIAYVTIAGYALFFLYQVRIKCSEKSILKMICKKLFLLLKKSTNH